MTGPQFGCLVAALTAPSVGVVLALAWDMRHVLPRQIQARQVVAAAEQICWDEECRRIEQAEEET